MLEVDHVSRIFIRVDSMHHTKIVVHAAPQHSETLIFAFFLCLLQQLNDGRLPLFLLRRWLLQGPSLWRQRFPLTLDEIAPVSLSLFSIFWLEVLVLLENLLFRL